PGEQDEEGGWRRARQGGLPQRPRRHRRGQADPADRPPTRVRTPMRALLFDMDGTLVDTVYAHVLAWQRALAEAGVSVDAFRLHPHVGSSGELIVRHAQRDAGRTLSAKEAETVHRRHAELFRQLVPSPRALPGAAQAFRTLSAAGIPHAITTASYRP